MLEQLRFYFAHSFNDLRRNQRLTFFAMLSIAAGVAAIVSLQSVTALIGQNLDANLQANNRGDINLSLNDFVIEEGQLEQGLADGILNEKKNTFFGQDIPEYYFSETGMAAIQAWIDENYAGQAEFTYRQNLSGFIGIFSGGGLGTLLTHVETGEQSAQVSGLLINPDTYPYYSEVRTTDGLLLSEVLQAPTDIVVGQNVVDGLDLAVGDTLQLNGATSNFTIRGIVSIENEVRNPFQDIFAGLFGFYYLRHDAVSLFEDTPIQSNIFYIKLNDPTQVVDFDTAFGEAFPYFESTTIEDARESNEQLVKGVNQSATIVGLMALLLGSIGIVNTMQVLVRRRMLEIAVLKTLGLQGNQVSLLFLTEAFLIGLMSSIIGIGIGIVATYLLSVAMGILFGADIHFTVTIPPLINGFFVGTLVTTVFGFLPTLSAAQVRPGTVLRPSESVIPRAGIIPTILTLIAIIFLLSLVANQVLGNFGLALGIVAGAFTSAGVLYVILWILIWIIGRLLLLIGIVDVKISIRQMLAARQRGASTLLALAVGIFALSTITLISQSLTNIMNSALEQSGSLLVSIQNYNQLPAVETVLKANPAVESYQVSLAYQAEFVSLNDKQTNTVLDIEGLKTIFAQSDFPPLFPGTDEERLEVQTETINSALGATSIEAIDLSNPNTKEIKEGRNFNAGDAGQPVIILTESIVYEEMGIGVGDTIIFRITSGGGGLSLGGLFSGGGEEISFEIIGIYSQSIILNTSASNLTAPQGVFPESINPTTVSVLVDVPDDELAKLRRELSEIQGTFAIDASIFTRLVTAILGTVTIFPRLVGVLGLIVGGVVIANSVALSTMERQREIAVMKAVGLQRERVLGMLLLENAILGLIGGVFGVGFGLVSAGLFVVNAGASFSVLPYDLAALLLLLCMSIAIVAALTSAWSASGEKPLTVLRYE